MKILLAYSGGLDTSVAIVWLQKQYNAEIIGFCSDVGQEEDLEAARAKALRTGAKACHVLDQREEFVRDFVFPAVRGAAIYEGEYYLGTALARPCIARGMMEVATREGCTAIAHGSTGKGNDQVRFELTVMALDPSLTIEAQLAEVLLLHRVADTREAARRRSIDLLREVQVYAPERVLKSHPHELSGGLLQRVMIAMALSAKPEVLIADEPTTSLDVTIQSEILDLLASLQRTRGMSMLFITHDIQVARQVADEVAIMYGGHIVERGPADEVLDRPLHPYTQALLACVPRATDGSARLNTIAGQPLNLRELPRGCRFAPRCPYVQERCLPEVPQLLDVKGRRVRCVLYEEQR